MNKFTSAQQAWMRNFEQATGGFDVFMADYELGNKTFEECAEYNIALYRDHASETADNLERQLHVLSEAPK